MTYSDFVKKVAASSDTTQAKTKPVVDAVFSVIAECLKDGEEVKIPQFGKFCTSERGERTCRNLVTGENITVPAHNVAKFSPASALKEVVK